MIDANGRDIRKGDYIVSTPDNLIGENPICVVLSVGDDTVTVKQAHADFNIYMVLEPADIESNAWNVTDAE